MSSRRPPLSSGREVFLKRKAGSRKAAHPRAVLTGAYLSLGGRGALSVRKSSPSKSRTILSIGGKALLSWRRSQEELPATLRSHFSPLLETYTMYKEREKDLFAERSQVSSFNLKELSERKAKWGRRQA